MLPRYGTPQAAHYLGGNCCRRLVVGEVGKQRARHELFEQHDALIGIGVEELHRTAPGVDPQRFDLARQLVVGHADLECDSAAVSADRRGDIIIGEIGEWG